MSFECQYVAQPSFMIFVCICGDEVEGLLADDLEDVALPALERRVVEQEPEDVALGVLGELLRLLLLGLDLLPLLLEVLLGVDEGLHVVLRLEARDLGRLSPRRRVRASRRRPMNGGVRIDEVLEREAVVDELLDLVDAVPRDVRAGCASRGSPSCRSSGGSDRSSSGARPGSIVRPPVSRSVERKQKLFLKKSTCP